MSKHPAYDVAKNLAEANLPSNVQLEKGLENTKEALEAQMKQKGSWAPEYKLAKDTTELLDTTKQFIEEKNRGELLQQFIKDSGEALQETQELFNTQQFWIERNKFFQFGAKPITDIKQISQLNVESLKNLVLTLVNSGDFRALVNEFLELVQVMAKTEEQKTGGLPSFKPETVSNVPLTEEAKQKAEQTKEVAQKLFQDIKEGKITIPEDRKQLVFERLRSLVNKINADPNYQSAVNGLFQLFDHIQYWGIKLKEQAKEQVVDIQKSSAIWRMWNDAKLFIANFTGNDILQKFIDDFNNFYTLVLNDTRLKQFFWEFRDFTTKVIQNPQLLESDEFNKKWNNMYLYSHEWMNDPRYKDFVDTIYFDFNNIFNAFKTDKVTQQLGAELSQLARDVVLDESGKPSLDIMTTGLDNLRLLLAPILKKHLENVAVPSFSGSNDTYDWTVNGMFLNAASIIPDNFELKVWGDAKVSLTDEPSKAATYITMWIRDIGLNAKDLKFHFKRKAVPKLEDSGIADVNITGKGSKIKIVWKVVGQQHQPWIFSVYQVNCSLEDVDITVKEATHSWLLKFITTLFSGSIRRSIEEKIESSIIDGLGTINHQLNNTVKGIGL